MKPAFASHFGAFLIVAAAAAPAFGDSGLANVQCRAQIESALRSEALETPTEALSYLTLRSLREQATVPAPIPARTAKAREDRRARERAEIELSGNLRTPEAAAHARARRAMLELTDLEDRLDHEEAKRKAIEAITGATRFGALASESARRLTRDSSQEEIERALQEASAGFSLIAKWRVGAQRSTLTVYMRVERQQQSAVAFTIEKTEANGAQTAWTYALDSSCRPTSVLVYERGEGRRRFVLPADACTNAPTWAQLIRELPLRPRSLEDICKEKGGRTGKSGCLCRDVIEDVDPSACPQVSEDRVQARLRERGILVDRASATGVNLREMRRLCRTPLLQKDASGAVPSAQPGVLPGVLPAPALAR